MIDAYVAGVNSWVSYINSSAGASHKDLNYTFASQSTPKKWSPADVVSIAGLIGGIFGRGGGQEVANAGLYQYLQKTLGDTAGAKAFSEFKEQNDPTAPTTIVDKKFPYETPTSVNPKLTAMPDDATAALTGGPTDTTSGCDVAPTNSADATALADIAAIGNTPRHMSNALVVSAKETKADHPIAVFGPQVSYYSPQILSEEEISAPSYHAEGASFPRHRSRRARSR